MLPHWETGCGSRKSTKSTRERGGFALDFVHASIPAISMTGSVLDSSSPRRRVPPPTRQRVGFPPPRAGRPYCREPLVAEVHTLATRCNDRPGSRFYWAAAVDCARPPPRLQSTRAGGSPLSPHESGVVSRSSPWSQHCPGILVTVCVLLRHPGEGGVPSPARRSDGSPPSRG